jgi:hypothetical protein
MRSGRFDGAGRAHYFSRTKGHFVIVNLALAVLAVATPLPVATSAATGSVTWNGITLGAPSATLRTTIGDPLRVTPGSAARIARYWIPGTRSSYFLVLERNGYVIGFVGFTEPDGTVETVPPDPFGVRVGDAVDTVKAKHPNYQSRESGDGATLFEGPGSDGVRVAYRIVDGHVVSFQWGTAGSDVAPALPEIADPSGDSIANAILDAQRTETDGVAWEYRYLAFHPCTERVAWKLQSQSLMNSGKRAYDRLHVVCPANKEERDFYFDITPYFGKGD